MNKNDNENTSLHLASIAKSLDLLALLKIADFFYSPDERKKLLTQCKKLYEEDQAAFSTLKATMEIIQDGSGGYEQRMEKYGEAEAKAQNAPYMQALEKRQETLNEISRFEADHPTIHKLASLGPNPMR